jgi:hypothetical protein
LTDLKTLIIMLFNYKFKRCKYCNKYFYPQHNRQVHCCDEHRIKYFRDNEVQKRFNKRKKGEYFGYIDNNRSYVTARKDQLKRLGSLNANLGPHRCSDIDKEKEQIESAISRIGLRRINAK